MPKCRLRPAKDIVVTDDRDKSIGRIRLVSANFSDVITEVLRTYFKIAVRLENNHPMLKRRAIT